METKEVVKVENLKKYFPLGHSGFWRKKKEYLKAVDGISFTIDKGEVLALVGESGCGKSTTGRILVGLETPTEGRIFIEGKEIKDTKAFKDKSLRQHVQMIFQDPYASLNPRMTIGEHLMEPLLIHYQGHITKGQAEVRALKMLKKVGLTPEEVFFSRYPHQLSGGQRQRVVIARAMILQPKFVVADEAVSMIDLSLRASILELLLWFKKEFQLSMLFIAHDFSVAKVIANTLGVMYLGNMVEIGPMEDLIKKPKHPYTAALLSAIPSFEEKRFNLKVKGDIPNPKYPPPGCKFHPRCPLAREKCSKVVPELLGKGHKVACHYPLH
ncbi:oligopeptide/dipeptide ABC transporter, ATPase subunit [Thermodesulfatator indicus DSM 15286]|uniref:Oligopeptide/dipeptide ABC transporter, ATPase subunit n=1 Tax=Thermodesulfatator indicus (strain DSM 15286 / JCM 11887 / CIR29812) TaxID=667014 RepID=F8ADH9_THEID|nr:oligopeptide/dipeptide ABC transporter ATP-binding protein [Thermodesulfatator indicus]AEH44853.1 oligopeptide/dipeptide ABC transporter, ATPase subunit [Thermodesulfatator indicus DSM 15286]